MKLEGNLASQRLGVKKHILVKSLGWDTIIKIDNLPVVDVDYLYTPEFKQDIELRLQERKQKVMGRKYTKCLNPKKRQSIKLEEVLEIVSYEELVNNSYSRIIRKYDLKCSQSVLVRARKILKGEL